MFRLEPQYPRVQRARGRSCRQALPLLLLERREQDLHTALQAQHRHYQVSSRRAHL